MGDRKKNVDAVFRNALSGLQTKPDEQVWERISDKLDKKKNQSSYFGADGRPRSSYW